MKEQLKAMARNPWVQRGVLLTTLLSAAACDRDDEEPVVFPANTPSATAKSGEVPRIVVQPIPTETPKPIEKGTIGDLRLIPVSVEEFQRGPDNPRIREGYKGLRITLAVQNTGSTLKDNREIIDDLNFKIQAAEGFSYPQAEAVKGNFMNYGRYNDFRIPPRFQFPMIVGFEIPTVAKELKIVTNSKSRPQTPVTWDLSTELPPPGQRRPIEYPLTDTTGLKKLGEPLENRFLVLRPQQIRLVMGCSNYADWTIVTQWQIENKYGYELTSSVHFAIFDKEGHIWKLENPQSSVAPGFTKVNYASGSVGVAGGIKCYDDKRWIDKMPPPPRDLKMLVWGEEPWTTEARQKVQTPVVWGVYNLGDIPIAPPVIGGYIPHSLPELFGQK